MFSTQKCIIVHLFIILKVKWYEMTVIAHYNTPIINPRWRFFYCDKWHFSVLIANILSFWIYISSYAFSSFVVTISSIILSYSWTHQSRTLSRRKRLGAWNWNIRRSSEWSHHNLTEPILLLDLRKKKRILKFCTYNLHQWIIENVELMFPCIKMINCWTSWDASLA